MPLYPIGKGAFSYNWLQLRPLFLTAPARPKAGRWRAKTSWASSPTLTALAPLGWVKLRYKACLFAPKLPAAAGLSGQVSTREVLCRLTHW